MNTSSLTDTITGHIPSPSSAAASISSTFDDVTGQISDLELPDLGRTVRRTRRKVARVVPWMSSSRLPDVRAGANRRWLLVGAAIVAAVVVIVVLRRRSASEPDANRDDWVIPPTGDSRPAPEREREPATSRG